MFSFLPIIGPLIDGIVKIFYGYQSVAVEKVKAEVATTQAIAQTTQAFKDDLGFNFLRDLALFPAVAWIAIFGWDNIVVHNWPSLYLPVAPWAGLEWYPYAAVTCLFGLNLMNIWKR